jgi:hypothetical protein
VPRTKYTKPPGPFPSIEQIQRPTFRFRESQRRKLTKLLPDKLAALGVTQEVLAPGPKKVETMADLVVQITEHEIDHYLTTKLGISKGPMSPANVRVAIRNLRKALEPFIHEWVDDETARLVPDPAHQDAQLAARYRELEQFHVQPKQRRLPLAVTVKRACELSGLGLTSIWAFIGDGRLEVVRVPGIRRTLVSYASLARLLAPPSSSPTVRRHRRRQRMAPTEKPGQ